MELAFRNEADGVIHQGAVTDLDIGTKILHPAEWEATCSRARAIGGVLTCACTFHSLMTGQVVVGDPDALETALQP